MVDFVYPISNKKVTTGQLPITDLKHYLPNREILISIKQKLTTITTPKPYYEIINLS
ncbi:hypothetical protein [Legionella maioricensis]|uniref:Uncharacterized protein n=1 Tax=Legionella maioricensis TaxID=2896528 RepID=A0A9X2CYP1_9GAMM|nr:hypothetical protein [Legionella maioricensis]MCL9683218.1 hypothetical protein [Legionella maioricensis]MCL9686084.1 hypothetical protein [Legionella maioricensis]